jgi:ribonuclease P protein subunit RPR2
MGKATKSKPSSKIPNKHLHSRLSYLFRAAKLLSDAHNEAKKRQVETSTSLQPSASTKVEESVEAQLEHSKSVTHAPPLTRLVLSHLRSVSLKSQIRLTSIVKHSICKHCEILLIPGTTSTTSIENLSKGGSKPWADVKVTTCTSCGNKSRVPVGAPKQKRRKDRSDAKPKPSKRPTPATAKIQNRENPQG